MIPGDPATCDDPSDYRSQAQRTDYLPRTSASAVPLLARLSGVTPSANGWRARCPACGGTSRKLSIAECDDRVLLYCFACSDTQAILDAVGLRWADLQPPRHWPDSPAERERARKAMAQVAIADAATELAVEWKILLFASQAMKWGPLSDDDAARLKLAGERIDRMATLFGRAR